MLVVILTVLALSLSLAAYAVQEEIANHDARAAQARDVEHDRLMRDIAAACRAAKAEP